MPKTCPQCGNITDDRYVFCAVCGALMDDAGSSGGDAPAPVAASPVLPVAKKRNKTGILIGLSAAAVIAAVAAIVVVIFLNGGGSRMKDPQAVLDRMLDKLLDADYEGAADCIYEFRYSDEKKQEFLDSSRLLTEGIPTFKELGIDKETLKTVIFFKVERQEAVTLEEENEIKQTLSGDNVPTDAIEEIVKADVSLTVTGVSQTVELYFVKADGGWYYLNTPSRSGRIN